MNATALLAVGLFFVLLAFAFAVVRTSKLLKFSLGNLQAEFQPNSGKTMRDAVDTMRDAVDRLENKVDGHFVELFAKVEDHEDRITALEEPKPKPRTTRPRKKAA